MSTGGKRLGVGRRASSGVRGDTGCDSCGRTILAFTIVAKYILTDRPLVAFKDDAISTFLDHHLELIKGEFEAWHPAEDIEVRVNIMKPGRRSVFSFGGSDGWAVELQEVLSITAWAGDYSKLERDIEWRHD